MIPRDIIYANAIADYKEFIKENRLKFSIIVQVVENSEVSKLPKEAFMNGFLFATFDFGTSETWVADQVDITDGMFSCILVYAGPDGWQEYPVSFPCIHIIGIEGPEIDSTRTVKFSVTKEDKEFEVKVNNSKKHLKLVKSWNNDASN